MSPRHCQRLAGGAGSPCRRAWHGNGRCGALQRLLRRPLGNVRGEDGGRPRHVGVGLDMVSQVYFIVVDFHFTSPIAQALCLKRTGIMLEEELPSCSCCIRRSFRHVFFVRSLEPPPPYCAGPKPPIHRGTRPQAYTCLCITHQKQKARPCI